MTTFFRRLRRRWFGPTTREILWMIHIQLESIEQRNIEAVKAVEKISSGDWRAAEARLSEILDSLSSGPLMALKKWLEICTKSQSEHVEQRREFIDREHELLARWKKQVEQFDSLMNERYDREPVVTDREPVATSSL